MEPVPETWERAVTVVAHPDDLEYGMASAIARFTGQGKQVSYVLVTSGEAGIDGLAPGECGPLRREEQRRSAAAVSVDHVEFLGHPDGSVEYGLGLRRDIAGALRRLRPEVVFGMNFDLTWGESGSVNQSDHRAVGVASLEEHRAYIDGLGQDFDPDRFLRDMGGYGGMLAGCEYAVLLQSFSV